MPKPVVSRYTDHVRWCNQHAPHHRSTLPTTQNMDEVYESAPWLFAMLRKRFNGSNAGDVAQDAPYQGAPGGPTPDLMDTAQELGSMGPEITSDAHEDGYDMGSHNPAPQSFEMFLPKKNRPTGNNDDLFGSGYVCWCVELHSVCICICVCVYLGSSQYLLCVHTLSPTRTCTHSLSDTHTLIISPSHTPTNHISPIHPLSMPPPVPQRSPKTWALAPSTTNTAS